MTVQLCTDLSKVIFCHVYVADNLVPIYNRRIHQGASFTDINWLAWSLSIAHISKQIHSQVWDVIKQSYFDPQE